MYKYKLLYIFLCFLKRMFKNILDFEKNNIYFKLNFLAVNPSHIIKKYFSPCIFKLELDSFIVTYKRNFVVLFIFSEICYIAYIG